MLSHAEHLIRVVQEEALGFVRHILPGEGVGETCDFEATNGIA